MAVESAADRAAFFSTDEFGQPATWNHGGTVATVNGILSAPASQVSTGEGPDTIAVMAKFVCSSDDLPAGAGQGDAIVIGGVSYVARMPLPTGNGMITVELERVA